MLCHRNSHEGLATGEALAVCAIQPFDHATLLATDTAQTSAAVSTTRCGDTCPIFPGKRYEDWQLNNPAGLGQIGRASCRERVYVAELNGLSQDKKYNQV